MTQGYGYPAAAPVPFSQPRPPCWGKSYDENNRECKGCPVQVSCKDEIIKLNVQRRPYYGTQPTAPAYPAAAAPVPGYFPQPPQPRPYQPPQQIPIPVANQGGGGLPLYGYGWIRDPMFHTIHQAPVERNQFPGESFGERAIKNVALSLIEALFGSLLLAVRQWSWAPKQPASEKVIDVQVERR
jgi:hypothetical protein